MHFTGPQEEAIYARNPELLVSAAAGSGKTAVLVERIFSLLANDEYSIDRMLVVTFTNAAAAEMRERLETRLGEDAAANASIRRQAELVENAQISTLHAFCQKLVREYFEVAGVDPAASLCDDVQRSNLLHQALEETLQEVYQEALAQDDLRALIDRFTPEEIGDMLLSLHKFLMSLPHPFQWLSRQAAHSFSIDDLQHSLMAEALLADCRILLEGAWAVWNKASALSTDPHCRDGYAKTLQEDGDQLALLRQAAQENLSSLMTAVRNASFGRMPSIRLTEPEEIALRESLKEARDAYKKRADEMQKLLPANADQALVDLQSMTPALQGLAAAVQKLDQHYLWQKSQRNLLDFADLEHMALAILEKPDLQSKISRRFDAVFVDEYQDISEIQEALLRALQPVSHDDTGDQTPRPPFCRFYVGDVKQSIYRFRQADPTLFMDKQARFSSDPGAAQRKISLSQNFRSREAILDAVNRVFAHVMRANVTEIDYDEEAMLRVGRSSQQDPPAQLHVLTQKIRAADQPKEEARLIAEEIKRLVGQPLLDQEGKDPGTLGYRDMVILLPVAQGKVDAVEQVLTQAGIPVYCEDRRTGFSPEVEQALAHLRLLDHLMDDLSLLAALRGPQYALTEEELGQIRLHKPESKASFLEAMIAASLAQPQDSLCQRCSQILADLKQERFLQQSMPLDEYLWAFLSRSGMYGFYGAQPGGKLRQANLRMLCDRARSHVEEHGGDLHDFLSSLTSQSGVHDDKSPAILSPWENVVRIMTIHKSKGLEFPVVFVMGLGGNLQRPKRKLSLRMHAKLGVALPYINPLARTKRITLLGSAIDLRARMEDRAERARVLYVAMTRAKDRLYLLGCGNALAAPPWVEQPSEKVDEKMETAPTPPVENQPGSAYAVWDSKSMLEWVWQTLQTHDEITISEDDSFSTEPLRETKPESYLSTQSTFFPHKKGAWRVVFHNELDKSTLSGKEEITPQEKGKQDAALRTERLHGLLESVAKERSQAAPSASLPIAASLLFPAPLKIGVTAYCRSLEAEASLAAESAFFALEEGEAESVAIKRLPLPLTRPRQLADLPALPPYLRQNEPQTGLLRGVAAHKALSLLSLAPLQACLQPEADCLQALEASITSQLLSLVQEGSFTVEEMGLLQVSSLAMFFASPLGRRALASQEIHREWSFNLLAPDLCESILQGVIDLCFLEEDQWVLVDFKTDSVSSPEALWPIYRHQVEVYRRALATGTGKPVRETALFSLSLGTAFSSSSSLVEI